MIVISAGMQKSGSAYIYNIINDLLIHSGYADTRMIKEKYKLEHLLKWHNNNMGDLSLRKLMKLILISFREKVFVVKTHAGPSKWMNRLLKLGLIKVIYIYRDPRDVYLSAVDHGKKILDQGANHTFARMLDLNNAQDQLKSWIKIWKKYNNTTGIVMIRYEDLLEDPRKCIDKILKYLNIKISSKDISLIISRYDRNNPQGERTGMHFNKALVGRYRTALDQNVRTQIESAFREDISAMGYTI
jgi:hypothetical protein